MRRRLVGALSGAVVLIAGLAILAIHLEPTPVPRPPLSGGSLHATSLPDLDGRPQVLGQWGKRPLLINFWATWCVPCVEEIPRLVEFDKRHGKDLQVIGIAADSRVNVGKFKERFAIRYPLLVDEGGAIEFSKRLGNRLGLLPFSLLVRPDGEVAATIIGALDDDKLAQMLAIAVKM